MHELVEGDEDLPESKKAMAEKLRQDNAAVYRRRKAVAEPVNGQVKRCQGFREFQVRGLANVSGEWSLVSLCHSMLELCRAGYP